MTQSKQAEIFIQTLTQLRSQLREEDRIYREAQRHLRVKTLAKRLMEKFRPRYNGSRFPAKTKTQNNHFALEASKRMRDE